MAALLSAFVVVPGAILAFHSAPAPAHVDPAAEELLRYIDGLNLASVDCRALHRRVICTTGTLADTGALSWALYETDRFPGDCETRGHRTVCVLGNHL